MCVPQAFCVCVFCFLLGIFTICYIFLPFFFSLCILTNTIAFSVINCKWLVHSIHVHHIYIYTDIICHHHYCYCRHHGLTPVHCLFRERVQALHVQAAQRQPRVMSDPSSLCQDHPFRHQKKQKAKTPAALTGARERRSSSQMLWHRKYSMCIWPRWGGWLLTTSGPIVVAWEAS